VLQNIQTSSLAHPASYPTRRLSLGVSGQGMELTIHLHPELRLKMSGATSPMRHMPSLRA